jgi:hypothetical protein
LLAGGYSKWEACTPAIVIAPNKPVDETFNNESFRLKSMGEALLKGRLSLKSCPKNTSEQANKHR